MSSNADVDYYDVQRMIEDEASRLRALIEDTRTQLRGEITELRGELADALINKGTLG